MKLFRYAIYTMTVPGDINETIQVCLMCYTLRTKM